MVYPLFTDVDMNHPWVSQYRLPVTKNQYPSFSYFVAVVVPSADEEADEYYLLTSPTEDEAKILASYLEYRIDYFGYYQSFVDKMRREALDLDGAVNTISILKRKDGSWAYKKQTWEHGAVPFANAEFKCNSVVELLDYIENGKDGKPFTQKWNIWKAEHGIS